MFHGETYLLVDIDGDISQGEATSEDVETCLNGDLTIIRFKDGRFQEFTPIDTLDTENWSDI